MLNQSRSMNVKNQTWSCWLRSANATSVLCRPQLSGEVQCHLKMGEDDGGGVKKISPPDLGCNASLKKIFGWNYSNIFFFTLSTNGSEIETDKKVWKTLPLASSIIGCDELETKVFRVFRECSTFSSIDVARIIKSVSVISISDSWHQ